MCHQMCHQKQECQIRHSMGNQGCNSGCPLSKSYPKRKEDREAEPKAKEV